MKSYLLYRHRTRLSSGRKHMGWHAKKVRTKIYTLIAEIAVSKDSPGFIANAILMPMLNEAILVLEKVRSTSSQLIQKGIATAEDIDKTFRLGMGHPMGPLALADLIGLDTCLAIQKVLHTETGDSKYRPSGLLVRMVDAGWVGVKGGRGFYEYK